MTIPRRWISVCILAASLSACATDYVSSLHGPNFGMRALNPDQNVDSRLLMNGLYAPKPFGVSPYAISPYTSPCLTADYRCAQQTQSHWSSSDP